MEVSQPLSAAGRHNANKTKDNATVLRIKRERIEIKWKEHRNGTSKKQDKASKFMMMKNPEIRRRVGWLRYVNEVHTSYSSSIAAIVEHALSSSRLSLLKVNPKVMKRSNSVTYGIDMRYDTNISRL
jgi:hypothetical protein